MARYVDKFGGSSVAGAERLYAAARKLAAAHRAGNEVVGVLSAQAGATDALLARGREIDPDCGGRELDALLSTGELCYRFFIEGRKIEHIYKYLLSLLPFILFYTIVS